jgi:hypothetical protein
MSQTKEIIIAVTGFLNKAFDAWKSYLDTRQEAYIRKMDKRKRKAIDYAEQIILIVRSKYEVSRELDKLIIKFFKYNN